MSELIDAQLESRTRALLEHSSHFCIIPWVHLHAHPDGRAFPCCLSTLDEPLGNLRETNVEALWNAEPLRRLRLAMLDDRPSPSCRKCYERERSGFFSKRNSSNAQLGHHIDQVLRTQADGSVAPNLVYWDIRFSNLCNLACRSCFALFSSSWYDDQRALYGDPGHPKLMHVTGDPERLWAQLLPHIEQLEKITFGGGEPLIMDDHHRLLLELRERGLFHVKLHYHTNLTSLKTRDFDVLELWSRFDEVHVGASLDAMGPRAELMRHGTRWDRIEANRRRMLDACPNVDFFVAATLSVLNCLHLPDFHRAWVDAGLIEARQFQLSVLQEPVFLRLDTLPQSLADAVRERYRVHIDWLETQPGTAACVAAWRSALRFLDQTSPETAANETFRRWSDRLDALRGQRTREVFPELAPLLDAV